MPHLLLGKIPLFCELIPSDLDSIASLLIERHYKKGLSIFMEGDTGDELYIIKSGSVKIYRFNGAKEIILAIFRVGDFFGEMASIRKDQIRSASAETLEPTILYVLKRSDLERLLEAHPRLTLKLLDISMNRLQKTNEQIQDLTFLDVRTRIKKLLVRLSQEHGVQQDNGVLIDLKLTHKQIADMVGSVRETVTKVLLELQDEDNIVIDKKKILLIEIKRPL
ncbi:MAG TPA: Crp/Fnr family transcriptional regulator [Paenibacillaceae bacterium]|nr:Crp/Fnr family transcriptional regulator [Paenibacillaceae bacterium]